MIGPKGHQGPKENNGSFTRCVYLPGIHLFITTDQQLHVLPV